MTEEECRQKRQGEAEQEKATQGGGEEIREGEEEKKLI